MPHNSGWIVPVHAALKTLAALIRSQSLTAVGAGYTAPIPGNAAKPLQAFIHPSFAGAEWSSGCGPQPPDRLNRPALFDQGNQFFLQFRRDRDAARAHHGLACSFG
jgi:hypothetical protein